MKLKKKFMKIINKNMILNFFLSNSKQVKIRMIFSTVNVEL